MAKINLDILKKPAERQNPFVFTDLKLDLKIDKTFNNELEKKGQIKDIQSSNNLEAIRNAFVSLLTTSPGEKILNPTFGINFGDLLFLILFLFSDKAKKFAHNSSNTNLL